MKKFINILICVLILILSLSISVFAKDTKYVQFNDDFTVMEIDGNTYSRINSKNLIYDGRDYNEYDPEYIIKYNDKNKEIIESVDIFTDTDMTIVDVDINYTDGSVLQVTFFDDRYIEAYNNFMNLKPEKFEVEFLISSRADVSITYDVLFENEAENVNISVDYLDYGDYFDVVASSMGETLYSRIGYALKFNGEWYFCFCKDNWYKDFDDYIFEELDVLKLRKISDTDTINELNTAHEYFLGEDLGFVYNDELTDTITKVFSVIIMGIIPLGLFISSLALAIKTKNKAYKKIFIIISTLCLIELIVFGLIGYFLTSENFVSQTAHEIQDFYSTHTYYGGEY